MAPENKDRRSLQIISAGMIAAVLLLLPIALFMRQSLRPTGNLNVLAYLASGWAVVSVLIGDLMRSARWPTTTPEQDPKYWRQRSSAQIVSMGIVEGAALFCCISLMITTTWWPLAAILVPLGAMLAWFPREKS